MAYTMKPETRERMKKAVNTFNRIIDKLNRQYQSGAQAPIIPAKRSLKSIERNITSYEEMRSELRALQRIGKGKALDIVNFAGVDMPKFVKQQLQYDLRYSNKKREQFRDLIGYGRNVTDTENMRDRVIPNLKDLDQSTIQHIINSIHSETLIKGQEMRLQLLFDNYKQSLDNNLTKGQAKRIKEKMDKLGIVQFAKAYVNGIIEPIGFIYGNNKNAKGEKAMRVLSSLEDAENY